MESFRPHVVFSAAITLDGKLATRTGDSKLSSKKDKIRVHKLRSKVDAILIGKNTVELMIHFYLHIILGKKTQYV